MSLNELARRAWECVASRRGEDDVRVQAGWRGEQNVVTAIYLHLSYAHALGIDLDAAMAERLKDGGGDV